MAEGSSDAEEIHKNVAKITEEDNDNGQSVDIRKQPVTGKFAKQMSLPEKTSYTRTSLVSNNSEVNGSVQGSMYLSPYASSNTLTGTMYTASEGMHTSRSGMTSYSGNASLYLTPNIRSLASFDQTSTDSSRLNQIVYYSCHSNLKLLLENHNNELMEIEQKDNEKNETKLRELEETNKTVECERTNFKLLEGIYRRNSSKKKHSHEHVPAKKTPVQTVVFTENTDGNLKTKISSDSGSAQTSLSISDYKIGAGGTRSFLIEKILDMTNKVTEMLATYTGLDPKTHKENYRLTHSTRILSLVSHLLLLVESGALNKWKGKKLSEVPIEDEMETCDLVDMNQSDTIQEVDRNETGTSQEVERNQTGNMQEVHKKAMDTLTSSCKFMNGEKERASRNRQLKQFP